MIKTLNLELQRASGAGGSSGNKTNEAIAVALHPGTLLGTDLSRPFIGDKKAEKPGVHSPEKGAQYLMDIIKSLDRQKGGKFFGWDGNEIRKYLMRRACSLADFEDIVRQRGSALWPSQVLLDVARHAVGSTYTRVAGARVSQFSHRYERLPCAVGHRSCSKTDRAVVALDSLLATQINGAGPLSELSRAESLPNAACRSMTSAPVFCCFICSLHLCFCSHHC